MMRTSAKSSPNQITHVRDHAEMSNYCGAARRPTAHTCKPLFFFCFFLKEEEHGATASRSTWWWKRTLLTSLTIFSIMFCAWNSTCVPKYMSAHHHIWKAQFTREKIIISNWGSSATLWNNARVHCLPRLHCWRALQFASLERSS